MKEIVPLSAPAVELPLDVEFATMNVRTSLLPSYYMIPKLPLVISILLRSFQMLMLRPIEPPACLLVLVVLPRCFPLTTSIRLIGSV
jgi:hypothetical protein